VKLGRVRPPHRAKLQFKFYCPDVSQLPPSPPSIDYAAKAADALSLVYLNDQLGDCVIAGGYHLVGVWTGNAGAPEFLATDAQIIADYGAIGGYVVGNPATDSGCDEQVALEYWRTHGFADGSKLAGWLGLDANNEVEIKAAINIFEDCLLGIELPDEWITPFPSISGFVWGVAGAPNPNNGHCVVVVGYNTLGVQIATWGMIGTITWAALAAYCSPSSGGEIYVLLDPDEIADGASDPASGFDLAQLQADLALLAPPAPLSPPQIGGF
jgi:hypothetical protein